MLKEKLREALDANKQMQGELQKRGAGGSRSAAAVGADLTNKENSA